MLVRVGIAVLHVPNLCRLSRGVGVATHPPRTGNKREFRTETHAAVTYGGVGTRVTARALPTRFRVRVG
ncbi:hypothetical protein GCM10012275_64030 [Longimycelium tulufanense]|uniref:Uncharacterized protein n=1 Tax=Longimycelium tulufanense TaxID=907463 RepID=A0A8J3FZW3_9PSEU|nr:hypothetical protein GCM10012275_64030 [Longimycelium tulufanense]